MGDYQARFCERLEGKFLRPTRPLIVGMHYKRLNIETQESIMVNSATIDKLSNDFWLNCKSNLFYEKNIFFSKGLKTTKYLTLGLDYINLH